MKPMNRDEYRTVIAALGLTPAQAAEYLGVHEGTARRWDTAPVAVARLLRLIHRLHNENYLRD